MSPQSHLTSPWAWRGDPRPSSAVDPAGGRVRVRLRRAADTVQLEVSDTGIGIPAEALTHLFEEFYRAPNAKALEREGTGLGLAITKDLVTRYGGHIGVESQVGQGTTFTVVLPLWENQG